MECSICSRVSNFNFDSNYGQDLSPIVCKILEISTHPGYFNTTSLCFFCLQKIDQVERIFKEMDEIKLKLSTVKIEFEDDLIRTHKMNKNKPYGRQVEKRKKIIKEICSRSKDFSDSDVDMKNSSSLTDPEPKKEKEPSSFSLPKPSFSFSRLPTLSLEQNQNHEGESDTDYEDQNQDEGQSPANLGGVINDDYQEVIPTPPIVFEEITFEGLNKLHRFENKTFSSTYYIPPVPVPSSTSSSSFQQFRENNNNNKSQKKAKYTIKSNNFCSDCNLVFTSDHLMNQHQKDYHSKKVKQNCIMENNSEMTESDDVSIIYESEPISTQSQSQQYEENSTNMKISSGFEKFHCQFCSKRYFDRNGLKVHIETVHQNIRYPCPEPTCPEKFTRKYSMLQHVKRFHPNKAIICPIQTCSKIFVDLDSFKTHQLDHKNDKVGAFSCNICSKNFTDKSILVRHQDSHNENPYPCPHCDAKYNYLTSLARHVKFKHLLNISHADLKKYSNH